MLPISGNSHVINTATNRVEQDIKKEEKEKPKDVQYMRGEDGQLYMKVGDGDWKLAT